MALNNMIKRFLNDFSKGLNLYSDSDFTPVNLTEGQLLECRNAYWRGGLQKRKGMRKLSDSQIDNKPIRALHRFYRKGQEPQLLAACGDKIVLYNQNTSSWSVVKTGLSEDTDIFFTKYGPTEKVFIANGVDNPLVWNGSIMSDYSSPPVSRQFLIHRERVFAFNDGLTIEYSDNLNPDSWTAPSITLASDDPVITAAIRHTQNTADTSVLSQLLVFTDNTSWVLAGNDFVTLEDVTLEEISGQIGTSSPNSVVKTPRGVVFFGRQQGRNNVFLVLGEGLGARIIPVGDAIRQQLAKVPVSALNEVVADYFDGYYRLSVRPGGQVANTREWWLKMDNIRQGNIAWYGPMERSVGLRSIISLSGARDNNKIYGGGENGYVYVLDDGNNDDGSNIDVKIQTGFHDFGFTSQEKKIDSVYLNIQASGGSADLYINTDFQSISNESMKSISLAADGGTFPYIFPFDFPMIITNITTLDFMQENLKGIYFSFRIEFSEANENFTLNMIGTKCQVDKHDKREESL